MSPVNVSSDSATLKHKVGRLNLTNQNAKDGVDWP